MSISVNREITRFPLSALVVSAENMRTTKSVDDDFVESLFENGVIQPLLVRKEGEVIKVGAGGRRLTGLMQLVKSKRIEPDYPVPCLVAEPEDDMLTLSLCENLHKESPHSSLYFTAIKKLEKEGRAKSEICQKLCITPERYEQIIRLASVHSKIYRAFAASDLSEEQVSAFAATDNKKRQIEVWEDANCSFDIHPLGIRRALLGDTTTQSPAALYVGIDAYIEAGGKVTRDLFGDTHALHDPVLLNQLACEKLDLAKEALEQTEPEWSWVAINKPGFVEDPLDIGNRFYPKYRARSAEQKATIKAIEQELKAFDDIDPHDMTEIQDHQYTEIEDRLYETNERFDEANEYFLKKEMKIAGVVLSIGSDGQLSFDRGLQTKAQVMESKRAEKKKRQSAAVQVDETSTSAGEATDYSQALLNDVSLYKRSILKADLLKYPDLAIELFHYSCIVSKIRPGYYGERIHDLSVRSTPDETSREDFDTSKMNLVMEQAYKKLSLEWLDADTEIEKIEGYISLTDAKKKAILSYISALSLQSDVEGYIEKETEVQYRDYWSPGRENYFNRVPRDILLEHYPDIAGEPVTPELEKAPKKTLVETLSAFFEGKKTNKNWLPEIFCS